MSAEKMNARDCAIKIVDKKEEKDFLNNNHDQGYAKAIVCYGLFHKKVLVQLMSFGKPRFNKNYQWEVIRECTKKNCIVRGGTSKLWKHFLKNNSCHSCICYSYPHNGEFTDHYINYCNFKNIKKAKPEKKIYFIGEWNGKLKRIDKSILERHGVDRLLKTKQGQDRTNEQILLDLGFTKKEEDGYSPQVDIYYPFGVLYRVDDLTDGSFYIGMTEVKKKWNEDNYLGGGTRWNRHLQAHPSHSYKRTILQANFKTPKELREAEIKEISKYVVEFEGKKIIKAKGKLLNLQIRSQGTSYISPNCPECGGKNGGHRKGCSQYIVRGEPCSECGSLYAHRKSCSHYKKPTACSECGRTYGHKNTCSHYVALIPCSECGVIKGHLKTCSHYTKREPCPECGGINGSHKGNCSKAKRCPECGYLIQSRRHAKTCSHYKSPKVNKTICSECGGVGGHHKLGCKNYKVPPKCPECGIKKGHLKTCSHYKKPAPCPECGKLYGHKGNCSKVIRCPECGRANNRHKKECSKYFKNRNKT